ncbi:MAG: hypothetical protein RSC43_00170 [Clostridia bacterium]
MDDSRLGTTATVVIITVAAVTAGVLVTALYRLGNTAYHLLY